MAKLDYVCCKECKPPQRFPGCKTCCAEFAALDKKIRAEKEKIRKMKDIENAAISVQIENVRRNKKRKHEKGK